MSSFDKKFNPVRSRVDELALSQGCYFDDKAAKYVCAFIETFCRQSKGQWAGQPLALLDWQRDFIWRLFGWKRTDGTRRYRTFYLEVAKKNGKSTLMSGLSTYLTIADKEPGAEVYICACDRSQASIIYDESARMVRASPELSNCLDIIPSSKKILHSSSNSVMMALSADVPSKDGLNASAVIFDEVHRQAKRDMWEVMKYAGTSRRQPLLGSITTAGESRQGIWFEQRDYSDKVNNGILDDISHLGVIYRAGEKDDYSSPAVWRKANPSLEVTINQDDFRREFQEAEKVPTQWANFLRLRLNVITSARGKFLDTHKWNACNSPIEDINGRECYGGLDLASRQDLTAWARLFPPIDNSDLFDVQVHYFIPEDRAIERERKDNVPYLTWARQGYITLTHGDVLDYESVRAKVLEDNSISPVRSIAADPWNCRQFMNELQEKEGIPVVEARQTPTHMNEPVLELERLVNGERLRHGGNPVLDWNADNAVIRKNGAGLLMLDKGKSTEKIDGLAAIVNALAGYLRDTQPNEEMSDYESGGLLMF